jgi:hypothetical protein
VDRRRTLAALALALAGAAPAPPLRAIRWIDPALPRAEIIRALTTDPAECLIPPADAAARARIDIGRAMFAAPLLLGGQAARAGLSCAACHPAGRRNPHFAFPGVSGAPGTADVTSALFSRARGDGLVNPRPIPDLAIDPPRISRDPANPALRAFIRGLIVEEFDGIEPPPRILDGIVAYVRALGGACGGAMPRTATGDAGEALAAIDAAMAVLAEGDAASAHLLIAAARSALGRIDERFPTTPAIGHRLAARDGELRALQGMLQSDRAAVPKASAQWKARFERDIAALRAATPGSLYTAAAVDRALPVAQPVAAPAQPHSHQGDP